AQTDENIFIETLRDITDRVNIRNKIVEYEKAQIFAKISEGIAHHMGTPLSSMLLRIQMLKDDMENEKELSAYVNKLQLIENQIHYGKNIMQRLLKFSSESPGEKTKVDFLSIINEAIEVLYPILSKKNISIKINNENEYKIYADSDMIKLVISDILMNSIDALNNNGNIYIELSSDKNNFVNLKIRDNGKGIPSKVLPYVFEPFYTTKPAGKGTGLGLAVAKRIIKDHNGNISIESIEGKETVVNINLPEYNLLNENE
ncbi:MAG: hypothetical protein GTO02_17375, partial [Candidatus Dadabacteria bacterium]|nr:hypothetical protein [Candidatus Dadabacteria bacterium]